MPLMRFVEADREVRGSGGADEVDVVAVRAELIPEPVAVRRVHVPIVGVEHPLRQRVAERDDPGRGVYGAPDKERDKEKRGENQPGSRPS